MKDEKGRRRWLLGLVGTLFGTTAANALGKILPSANREPTGPVEWTLSVRHPDGSLTSQSAVLDGRMVIECDAQSGNLHVLHYDKEGRLLPTDEPYSEVSIRRVGDFLTAPSFSYVAPPFACNHLQGRQDGALTYNEEMQDPS